MSFQPSRRAVLGAGAVSVLSAGLASCSDGSVSVTERTSQAIPATGVEQAGVARPAVPQAHTLLVVADLGERVQARALLARLGDAITRVASQPLPGNVEPGDVTVTVGVGPRLVRAAAPRLSGAPEPPGPPELPGARELPAFGVARFDPDLRGGDLMVQVCASNPLVPSLAMTRLLGAAGEGVAVRWRQRGYRGPAEPVGQSHVPRNVMAFHDGIVVPRTPKELDAGVWLHSPARVAGGTIAVIMRFAVDVQRFARLEVAAQEAVVGRRLDSGAPLGIGEPDGEPDLNAKTPDGRYVVPVAAHVRRASPRITGVPLMMRRGYSIDDPAPGLLFVSYQNDLRTFVNTMQRMVESDALMDFAQVTASGTFLILPGFDISRPLGSTLFD